MEEEPSSSETAEYKLRPALEEDLQAVMQLLRPFVERRQLVRRTRAETAALIPTGFVVERNAQIVGFSAVEIYSKKLAEIQCLAVHEDHRKAGLGVRLVEACVELARSRRVMEVMAISSSDTLFQKVGFEYSLPNQKRALFFQLRSREEVYRELEEQGED